MDLAQILCNGVQSGEDRGGIKYRSAGTKHRGILRSCSRVNAECLPLISSVPLRLSGSKLQSLHFCLAHCRAKKTKNRNRNTKKKKKKSYPKANMRREVRTDSLTHKSTSIRHVRSTHVCERRIFAKVRPALHSSRFGELEYTE